MDADDVHPQKSRERWFISASSDLDLSVLIAGLRRRGAEPYVLSDVAELGTDVLRTVRDAVARADYVLLVLGAGRISSNAMFEAGIAVGQDKPLLVVADPKIKLPPDLAGVLTIRARPDDIRAIDFALDQARGRTPYLSDRAAVSGRPLGSQVDELLARLSVPVEGSTEREAVAVLKTALEESGVVAAQGGGAKDFFDLGVWSDDLDSIAANPLLVEVKKTVSPLTVDQVLRHLSAHPTARMALVVSLFPIEGKAVKSHGGTYPVLAIGFRDLLERMRTASFAEVVRVMRNRSVHGLPL